MLPALPPLLSLTLPYSILTVAAFAARLVTASAKIVYFNFIIVIVLLIMSLSYVIVS